MADDERRAEIETYRRANERLEAALLHIINRVSTEGRDDEHKHLFLVGSEAVKHARAEVADTPPSRDGSVAVEEVGGLRVALIETLRNDRSGLGTSADAERIAGLVLGVLAEFAPPASTGDRAPDKDPPA